MRLLNQNHYDLSSTTRITCGYVCVCVFSSWVCVPVRTHEWRLRDRFWLDWCPSPDESEILMCQQGWIMHAAPLPLFSTSCLQSFASLFITTATSEEIFTFIFSPPPSRPPPLCKRGFAAAAATSLSPGSALFSFRKANSFLSSGVAEVSPVEISAHFKMRRVQTFALEMAKCFDVHSSLSSHGRTTCSHWHGLTVTSLTDRSH